jgi:hypothetical protein
LLTTKEFTLMNPSKTSSKNYQGSGKIVVAKAEIRSSPPPSATAAAPTPTTKALGKQALVDLL